MLVRMSGLLAVSLAGAAVGAPAFSATVDAEAAVSKLVDGFVDAQRRYDPRVLSALTTADYVEVSPVGDVDTRAEMLSFYAPEKKQPAPPIALSERTVRVRGNEALMLAKLTMSVPAPGGAVRLVNMRASYAARRTGREWRLSAAQFTPMRSPQ